MTKLQTERTRVFGKTTVFTSVVIVTNVIGNLLLRMGMERVGSLIGKTPLAYIGALFHPLVAAGVGLLIVWLISHMTLLSWADLSFVMPVTSIGYVLSALAGRVFLNESVSWQRWGGIWLIVVGVILVSRTHKAITHEQPLSVEKKAEPVCS